MRQYCGVKPYPSSKFFLSSRDLIQVTIFTISALYLIMINRRGALLDAEVYRTAGEQVIKGINPYSNGFRSGPLGAVFIYLIGLIGPKSLIEILLAILNMIGILFFASKYLRISKFRGFLPFATLLIWSSPVREMLLNHQLVGICLGLITISTHLDISVFNKLLNNLVLSIPLSIALDLKPQLVIPILLFSIVKFKKFWITILAIVLIVVSNLVFSARLESILILDQINVINQINKSSTTGTWNDISNIWTILDYYLPNYSLWQVFSIISTIIMMVLILVVTKYKDPGVGLLLLASFPVFSIYCHTYDLVPLSAFAIYLIVKNNLTTINFWATCVILIPYKSFEIRNIIFLLMIIMLLSYSNENQIFRKITTFKNAFLGLILYFLTALGLSLLTSDQQQVNSRIVFYVWTACFITFVLGRKKFISEMLK